MFGGGTMGLRCQFVQFGGFPVFLVHDVSSPPHISTRRTNLLRRGMFVWMALGVNGGTAERATLHSRWQILHVHACTAERARFGQSALQHLDGVNLRHISRNGDFRCEHVTARSSIPFS